MYFKRFVNVETGEIFISYAPWNDKTDGVDGWAHVSFSQFKHIRENFCSQNFRQSLNFPSLYVLYKNLNKLKEYLKESAK